MVSPQMPAWHEQETFDPRPAELPHWPVIAVIDGARTVRSQIVRSRRAADRDSGARTRAKASAWRALPSAQSNTAGR
jgi:hypothetical protein